MSRRAVVLQQQIPAGGILFRQWFQPDECAVNRLAPAAGRQFRAPH